MSYYNLEDIGLYQLAESFGDEIWLIVTKRDNFVKKTIGRQLANAADSVSGNIAEGYGADNELMNQ